MTPPADSATPPNGCAPGSSWSGRKLLWFAVLVLLAQIAFFTLLGEPHPRPPGPQPAGPHLQIARPDDEFIALTDPSLFILPHPNSPGSPVWQQPPVVANPVHRFNPSPQFLPPTAGASTELARAWTGPGQGDLAPTPQFTRPELSAVAANVPASLHLSGALTGRPLLAQPPLPLLPANEVLPTSHVQVLVDPAGFVVSAVLLLPDNPLYAGTRPVLGDTTALQLARQLRFTPATAPVVGELYFRWQTRPANSPP